MMVGWTAVALLAVLHALGVRAAADDGSEGRLVHVATRADVTVPVFWVRRNDGVATLVLLPGGAGGIGRVASGGWPDGANVLIRNGRLFAAHGFNIAMVSRPSDIADLDYAARTSDRHLEDLRWVVGFARREGRVPVWLVATSRGTVSAVGAALALADERLVDGLVLASSIVSHQKEGALPYQRLERIDMPVLMVHHRRDACRWCEPREIPVQFERLATAPIRKLAIVDGGADPRGDPCEAFHWHSYVGMEAAFVDLVARWIKRPTS